MVWIFGGVLLALAVLILVGAYWAYSFSYKRVNKTPEQETDYSAYKEYKDDIQALLEHMESLPYEWVTTKSYDGLQLWGRYFASRPGAPLVILFHGYRSSVKRDCVGGIKLCHALGYNVLAVDQRAHQRSEGHALTFGVKERRDALSWTQFAQKEWGKDYPIFLYGVSMGAATVMMAADLPLPEEVKGIIADCGYNSPRDIIRTVCGYNHWPIGPAYFLARVAAIVFGNFDPESASAEKALSKTKIPLLLIHGDEDDFVPYPMSGICYQACASEKEFLTVHGARHAISYLVDTPLYEKTVTDFFKKHIGSETVTA